MQIPAQAIDAYNIVLTPPISPLHILVVEDDPRVSGLICSQLIEAGHQPEPAGNADEALGKFSASQFDLVITDLTMPGMDGNQLAITLKKIKPSLPIVLLTGCGDMMGDALPEAVDLVVCKPFGHRVLMESIATVMKR